MRLNVPLGATLALMTLNWVSIILILHIILIFHNILVIHILILYTISTLDSFRFLLLSLHAIYLFFTSFQFPTLSQLFTLFVIYYFRCPLFPVLTTFITSATYVSTETISLSTCSFLFFVIFLVATPH